MFDSAEPLVDQGLDDSVVAALERHLDAIDRAERRIEAGTYGRSVRSGEEIPDARLEADPTAELTVDEASSDGTAAIWPARVVAAQIVEASTMTSSVLACAR